MEFILFWFYCYGFLRVFSKMRGSRKFVAFVWPFLIIDTIEEFLEHVFSDEEA